LKNLFELRCHTSYQVTEVLEVKGKKSSVMASGFMLAGLQKSRAKIKMIVDANKYSIQKKSPPKWRALNIIKLYAY